MAAAAPPDHGYFNDHRWLYSQFRATSPGAIMRAVAESMRFDSRRWVSEIDVPTAVVVTQRDRAVPPRDQRWMAAQIPCAHTVTVDAGHASCTLSPKAFVFGLHSALEWVIERVDRQTGPRAVTR